MGVPVAADINARLNQQSMSTAIASLKSQFASQNISLKVNVPDLSRTSGGFKLVADSIDKTTSSINKFGEQAGIATKRLLAYTAATTALLGPLAVLRTAVDEAIKFQREIIRVSQVAGDTKTELRGLQDQITTLAKTYGVASLELVKSATVFRQAGFTAKETAESVEVLAKALLAPNFDNGTQIAETIVALRSQFKDAVKDGAALADTIGGINAVAGAFAVEAKDLEETIKRTGGAFAAAGGNVNELVALFTSVRQTTRESAETIATSFRTIFARLQRADIVDQLKSFGIELRRTREEAIALGNANLEGQFVGAYEAIRRLSAAVKDLPTADPRFAAIAEEIGGYRQLSKTIPLLQQFAVAQEALNVAQSGAASLNINAAQAQDAYTVKLTKVKEEIAALGRTIVDSPGFAKLFDFFTTTASAAVKFAEALSPLIPLLTALATAKLAAGLGSLGRGFIGGFGSKIDSAGRAITRNSGGGVPGVGSTDTVPAMLTPGEYVLRKEAVSRIGLSTLNAMNAGKPQGYNKGGAVQYFTGGGNVLPSAADSVGSNSNALQANTKALIELGNKFGLAGQKTSQGGLFREDTLPELTDKTKLLPSANSGRGPIKFGPLPIEPEPILSPNIPRSQRGALQFEPLPEVPPTDPLRARKTTGNLPPLAVSFPPPQLSPEDLFKFTSRKAGDTSTLPGVSLDKPDPFQDKGLVPLAGARPPSSPIGLPIVPTVNNVGSSYGGLSEATIKHFGLDKPTKTGFFSNLLRDDRRGNGVEATGKSILGFADRATSFLDRPATAIGKGLLDPLGTLAGGINLVGNGAQRLGGLAAAGGRNVLNTAGNFINGLPGETLLGKAGNLAGNGISGIGTGILNTVGLGANGIGVRGTLNKVGDKLNGFASNPLALAGAFFAADHLRQGGNNDITAQIAAQGPLSGAFKEQEGVKGALGGAQIGAGIGAVFGPLGIALGGLTGAIIGYTDGVKDAEKKIAQVKLDEILGKLKTEIDDNAAQKAGVGTGNINALLANAKAASFNNTNKSLEPSAIDTELGFAARASNRLFGTSFKDPSQAVNAETAVFQQRENFRNQIGLQLPQLNQIAGRQISNQVTVASQSGALGAGFNPQLIKTEGERFATGFAAANDELVKDIALIKQISIGAVVKEFQKQFEEQAKALSLANNKSAAKSQSENILNSIERLTKSFEAATEAVNESARANSLFADSFGGGASAVQSRNLSAGIGQLGVVGASSQASFLSSLGVVNNVANSKNLSDTALGLNTAKATLPDILSNALKSNPTNGENFGVRVSEQLIEANVPKAIRDSIVSKLEGLDIAELSKKIKESGEKFANELTADYSPIHGALEKIASTISSNSNALIAGLNQAGRNDSIITGSRNRTDVITLDRQRLSAQFRASNALEQNRFADVSPTDFLSEQQALRPFRANQRRLLAGNGFIGEDQGENVDAIRGAIASSQAKQDQLLKARDAAQGTAGEGQAIKEFDAQQQITANLNQSLKNLVENSDKLKDAQEKLAATSERLNKIESSRQTNIGLNERVFRAQSSFDFKDLRQIQLGAQGAEFLRQGGNIRNLTPEQGLATDSFLQSAGNQRGGRVKTDSNGRVVRDAKGKPVIEQGITNEQIRQEQFQNGPFQNNKNDVDLKKTLEAQQKEEQGKAIAEKERQEKAAQAYTGVLDTANNKFIANLSATFDKFRITVQDQKDNLERLQLGTEKRAIEVDRANVANGAGVAKDNLAKAGITTQAQLDLVRANAGDLANSGKLTEKFLAANDQDAIRKAKDAAADVLRGDSSLTGVQNIDTGQLTLDASSRDKLSLAFDKAGFTDNKTNARLVNQAESRLGHGEKIQPSDLVKSIVGNEFQRQSEDSQNELTKINGRVLNNFRQAGQGALGSRLIDSTANGGITSILDNSNKVGSTLAGVNTRLELLDKSLLEVTRRFNSIGAPKEGDTNFIGPVQGKAFGGSIFSPRGTDTVPAMLTPGEFVVSANAARNNLGLLQRINNGGNASPVAYKATGGSITVSNGVSLNGENGLDGAAGAMKAAFDSFISGTQNLVTALNNFPREITGNFNHRVEIIHNGVEMFANLEPNIVSLIEKRVEKSMESRDNKLRSQGINI